MASFDQTYAGATTVVVAVPPMSTKKVSRARLTVFGTPDGTITATLRSPELGEGEGVAVGYTSPDDPTTFASAAIAAAGAYDFFQDGHVLELALALGASADVRIIVEQVEG